MSKEKKQFRLFDVYRYIVTAEESKIKRHSKLQM